MFERCGGADSFLKRDAFVSGPMYFHVPDRKGEHVSCPHVLPAAVAHPQCCPLTFKSASDSVTVGPSCYV